MIIDDRAGQAQRRGNICPGSRYRIKQYAAAFVADWLSFSRCSLSNGDANWRIVTFGESPKHVNREDGSAYFRSTQIISDQLEFISYEFEDASQVYSVTKEDELYVFRDDQHIISKGQFEPFMFIMEDNNFAAISALSPRGR